MSVNVEAKENQTNTGKIYWYAWVIVIVCFVILSGSSWMRNSWAITTPLSIPAIGLTKAASGTLVSAALFGYLLGGFFLGITVDKFGCRKVVAISAILCGAFTYATTYADTFNEIFFLRFMGGICMGSFYSAVMNYTLGWFPPKSIGTGIGFAFIGAGLGVSLSSLVLTPVIQAYGWRSAFIATGIALWVMAAIVIIFGKEKGLAKAHKPKEKAGQNLTLAEKYSFLKNPSYISASIAKMVDTGAWQGTLAWLMLFLTQERGFSLAVAGAIYGVSGLFYCVGSPLSGWLGDFTKNRRLVSLITSILVAIATASIYYSNSTIMLWIALCVYNLCQPMPGTQMNVLQAELVAGPNSGFAMGFYNSITWIGAMFFPPILGWILDISGKSFALMFGVLSFSWVIGGIITYWFVKEKRIDPNDIKEYV